MTREVGIIGHWTYLMDICEVKQVVYIRFLLNKEDPPGHIPRSITGIGAWPHNRQTGRKSKITRTCKLMIADLMSLLLL